MAQIRQYFFFVHVMFQSGLIPKGSQDGPEARICHVAPQLAAWSHKG